MTRGRRGKRRATPRDPFEDHEQTGSMFGDLVEEMPGEDLDLQTELRRLGAATTSRAMAIRRAE